MNAHVSGIEGGLPLLRNLTRAQEDFWPLANRSILWGWKRDVGQESRAVYFSGELVKAGADILLGRHFFHFRAKLAETDAPKLLRGLQAARDVFAAHGDAATLKRSTRDGVATLEFQFGAGTDADWDRVNRLKLRRPRRRIPAPTLPAPFSGGLEEALWPADLYVGSGVSYEAGLPTLCEMHDIFCVDSETASGFTAGAGDPLPRLLADEGMDRVRQFCAVHVLALTAEPTPAMQAIARLVAARRVGRVFTDNVDNLLGKTGVGFERVRGSGVFNERHPVQFTAPNLIVVGVAADRRQIVRQARAAGVRIIVVNPCAKVSPNVMHLEYVRPDDLFFKQTAQEFLGAAVSL